MNKEMVFEDEELIYILRMEGCGMVGYAYREDNMEPDEDEAVPVWLID